MSDSSSITRCLPIGKLGRSALLATIGLCARAAIQACYLVILSRWMGPNGYGLFAGSVAAAVLVAPLSGWGISYVLSRRIALEPGSLRGLWATAIAQIAVSSTLLSIVFLAASSLLLVERMEFGPMLLLGVSELVALPMTQMAASVNMVVGRGAAAAACVCLAPFFRLVLLGTGLSVGFEGLPENAALVHFSGAIAGVLAALWFVYRIDGAPAWRLRTSLRATASEGTRYAVGTTIGIGYQEVDKVLLLQILGAGATGVYTAAFRIVSVFTLPLAALMSAAIPRLFAAHGKPEGARMLSVVVRAAAGYGLLAPLAAALVVPLMPIIFGEAFLESGTYLLLLAPWILPFALHQAAATGLTASGRQSVRVAVEGGGLVVVVALNVVLLPRVGATGAVAALLVAESLMALACSVLLRRAKSLSSAHQAS